MKALPVALTPSPSPKMGEGSVWMNPDPQRTRADHLSAAGPTG
jgi:hypothetical protein